MRAYAQLFAKVFRQRANVCTRRTNDAHLKIKRAVKIVVQQVTRRFDSFKCGDTTAYWLTLNLFAAPRQFVEFPPLLLLCRIHWRHLIDFTAQAVKRRFDLVLAEVRISTERRVR